MTADRLVQQSTLIFIGLQINVSDSLSWSMRFDAHVREHTRNKLTARH